MQTLRVTKTASPFIQDPVDEEAALIIGSFFWGHIHMLICAVPFLNGSFL